MTDLKKVAGYIFTLLFGMLLAFGVHVLIHSFNGISLLAYHLPLSYFVNFLLAVLIFVVIFLLKKKYLHVLGFIFMGGSLLKFAVFFIIFYPIFKQDELISTGETLAFLSPYLISLFIETFYLSKVLNSQD